MKTAIKGLVAPAARQLTRRYGRILMYHRFSADGDGAHGTPVRALEWQLRHLKSNYNVVPLAEIVRRLRERIPLAPRTVALTVDDAYADFGTLAYPVFRELDVPVTVYVISEFTAGRLWLWWDAIRHLIHEGAAGRYQVQGAPGETIEFQLGDPRRALDTWRTLARPAIFMRSEDRAAYLERLQAEVGVVLPSRPGDDCAGMTWDALRELDPAIVEIGAHTRTHPSLASCTLEEMKTEIEGSKLAIENELQRDVRAFCYPNGVWRDVDDRVIETVKEAAFSNSVMACGRFVSGDSNLYALDRFAPSAINDDFASDMAGLSFLRERVTGGQGGAGARCALQCRPVHRAVARPRRHRCRRGFRNAVSCAAIGLRAQPVQAALAGGPGCIPEMAE